ncbi:MAG TPA: DNA polymerase [Ktedonobacteraceae bacterium]|nr:DNA polymerase [Ktedonobacteraceae bacterium]
MQTRDTVLIEGRDVPGQIIRVREELGAQDGYQALDLETSGLHPYQSRIASLTLGRPGRAFVLDVRPYYQLEMDEQEQWKEALGYLFSLPSVIWVGHNVKFDCGFLLVHLGVRLRQVYDTMLVEQLIRGGRSRVSMSLQETAARYGFSVSKAQRDWFVDLHKRQDWLRPFPPEQTAYMVQDIEAPYRIACAQQEILQQQGLEEVARLENQALPAIASMEVHGAFIDQAQWKHILACKQERQMALERELAEALGSARYRAQQQRQVQQQREYEVYQQALGEEKKRLMHAYMEARGKTTWKAFYDTGMAAWNKQHPKPCTPKLPERHINLASSDQLIEALHGLDIHVLSTREEVLEQYASREPLIAKLLQWRRLEHFRSSFGENLLSYVQEDGRIHATFNQIGAVSGRIICNRPNLQQIPKRRSDDPEEEDIRRCFVAPPGCKLLKADLSNIELRILAEVARDAAMLQFFAEGKDLHEETAKLMFRLPADTDTRTYLYKGAPVRDIAKTINFGLSYGMGAVGLAARVGVSVEEAKDLMQTYFATYTGVASWLRRAGQQALKQGYAQTLAGRKRFFLLTGEGRNSELYASLERNARNHPIQGTNADILKRALALLYDGLPEGVHIVLSVHDEVVLESPEELCGEAKQVLRDALIQACRFYLKIVHIPDPEVLEGTYWVKG